MKAQIWRYIKVKHGIVTASDLKEAIDPTVEYLVLGR